MAGGTLATGEGTALPLNTCHDAWADSMVVQHVAALQVIAGLVSACICPN